GPDQTRLETDHRRSGTGAPDGRCRRRGPRTRRPALDRPGAARLLAHANRRRTGDGMTDALDYSPGELDRGATFYVAGHRGMVGSAIVRKLQGNGFENIVGRTSAELDLKDRDAVFAYIREIRPKYVVLAAAKVGGILANNTYPVDFLSDNVRIQVNVLD